MATIAHISSRLGLTLSLGEIEGVNTTKSISVSNLNSTAASNADTLAGLASAVGEMLAYPISTVKLYDTSLVEA